MPGGVKIAEEERVQEKDAGVEFGNLFEEGSGEGKIIPIEQLDR